MEDYLKKILQAQVYEVAKKTPLEKANNLKSNDPYIIDSLGWALFKLKRYEDSKLLLQSAVKLMPADPIVNDHYGDILWKLGQKIQARYFWKSVLKINDVDEELLKKIKDNLIPYIKTS